MFSRTNQQISSLRNLQIFKQRLFGQLKRKKSILCYLGIEQFEYISRVDVYMNDK